MTRRENLSWGKFYNPWVTRKKMESFLKSDQILDKW